MVWHPIKELHRMQNLHLRLIQQRLVRLMKKLVAHLLIPLLPRDFIPPVHHIIHRPLHIHLQLSTITIVLWQVLPLLHLFYYK